MHRTLIKYRERETGFTLIELLIVVLIVGILAAIAIPVYLGIQGQAHKSAVKADVNSQVTSMQVALTEGATMTSQYGTKVGSDKGSSITVAASTTTGAGSKDFTVAGAESTTAANSSGDKGSLDYSYTYDSVTGQFTEGDGSVVLGGGGTAPNFTTTSLPGGSVGTTYNQTIVVTGTPTPVLSQTAGTLPPGITFTAATGTVAGNPTTVGNYTFTIKAQNSSGAPTQSYTIAVVAAGPILSFNFDDGTAQGWTTNSYVNAGTYASRSGSYGLIMNTGGTGFNSSTYTLSALTPGHTYKVEGYYYGDAGKGATIEVDNSGGSYYATTTVNGNSTTFVYFNTGSFVYQAGYYIKISGSNPKSVQAFDDIKVIEQ